MICHFCIFTTSASAHKNNSLPTIKVGLLTGGWGPFQRWDGHNASGFSVELITTLARNLDYHIEWKTYPDWNQLYVASCKGQLDIMLDSFRSEESECVTYSRPYYSSPTVVVVRHDSPLFKNVSGLNKSRIAIEAGFLTEKLVRAHYPEVQRLLFQDTDMALQAVLDKRADAYIGNLHVTNQFIAQHPELAVVAQAPLLMESLHLGISKHNSRLGVRFDTAIQALSIEERSALEQRWLSDNNLNFQGHSGFLLRPDERDWLASLPPLKLSFIPKWIPFSYSDGDGKLTGLIGDYMNVFKDKLGLAYQYRVDQSWPELLQGLLHQDADIAVIPTRIIKRISGWQISQPIASFPVVIAMSRASSTFGGFAELVGKHLVVTDSLLVAELRARIPDIRTTVVSGPKEGLAMVASGRGDAYIGNLAVISRLINEQFDDSLHIVAPTPFRDELAVAVREPYTPLLPLINRVLASMSDKEKQQIRNSWLALNYSEGIPWHKLIRTLIPIGIGIALFILILSVAYWRLRQEIVRRRQVEAALAMAKAKAESAATQKGEFLATMSHEIRTPMNGIVGMAEQLTFTELTLEQRQMVEIINRGAQGLHALIDNVLDYAKLEAGKMQLEQTPFLLRELIDSVLTMTVSEVHRKGLRVYLWADAGVAARVSGDALRLRQILFNFVSNAIKFTERGFIEISVQLLAQGEGQQQLRFGVRDSGIGMTPEARDRIFNAFEQAESSTTRSYGGSGLGLSICQTLANLMGGEIRLESAPGLGTFITLTVTLPVLAQREPDLRLNGLQASIELHDDKLCHTLLLHLDALGVTRTSPPDNAQLRFSDHDLAAEGVIRVLPLATPLGYRSDEKGYILNSNPMTWHAVREVCYRQLALSDEIVTQAIQKSAECEPMLPCRVLLVEDNPLNQQLVIRQLGQLKLNCELAEHGQQALEMVAQYPYDLVLCDCQMPVMDGYEFTRRVRAGEDKKRLLIIAMTANVMPEQAERCFAAGMDDLLGKPVLLDGLRQMLQKWRILPSPSLIDVAAMAAFFGQGDKLRQMFPLFRQELEQAMGQQPQDDKALANWVHRQAGTVSMMMAPQLAEEAWRLEEKIRQFGSSACTDELTRFRAQLQQIIGELMRLSEQYEESVVVEGKLE
ncbi:TPA: ATP-binding protein [Aeromonas veronii]|uniref:ATP-binding protein n=1 Tax=Aeromonas TaxID=642 RepID=UPI0020B45C77|nr:transporter substrate-binding domain-containing protein [Aeromonas sp. FDAARGOS 1405]